MKNRSFVAHYASFGELRTGSQDDVILSPSALSEAKGLLFRACLRAGSAKDLLLGVLATPPLRSTASRDVPSGFGF